MCPPDITALVPIVSPELEQCHTYPCNSTIFCDSQTSTLLDNDTDIQDVSEIKRHYSHALRDVDVTVLRVKFLIIKQNRCNDFSNLFLE